MPNLLSPEECRQLVDLGERLGYGLAGARGVNLLARYALRALVDAPHLAEAIQARLAQLLPKEYRNQRLLRVNKRLRLLKWLGLEPASLRCRKVHEGHAPRGPHGPGA